MRDRTTQTDGTSSCAARHFHSFAKIHGISSITFQWKFSANEKYSNYLKFFECFFQLQIGHKMTSTEIHSIAMWLSGDTKVEHAIPNEDNCLDSFIKKKSVSLLDHLCTEINRQNRIHTHEERKRQTHTKNMLTFCYDHNKNRVADY